MPSSQSLEIVVLASGKRLHGLCAIAEWHSDIRLGGLWSPDVDERDAAAARYRVPAYRTPAQTVEHHPGAIALVGDLRSARPAVEAFDANAHVLAWPPFVSAHDRESVDQLIATVGRAGHRWRVARPVFRPSHPGGPFGQHVTTPREGLRMAEHTNRATAEDRLLGHMAVALACLAPEGADSGFVAEVEKQTLGAILEWKVRVSLKGRRADLSMSIGEGTARSLRLPWLSPLSGIDGPVEAPAWTSDDPRSMNAAVRTADSGAAGGDYARGVLRWLQGLTG